MDNRNKTLAILVKPFAFLSMVGSALVVREVLSDPTKRGLTYHRQLLPLSTADFLSSLWMFMSTWPIPEGTRYLGSFWNNGIVHRPRLLPSTKHPHFGSLQLFPFDILFASYSVSVDGREDASSRGLAALDRSHCLFPRDEYYRSSSEAVQPHESLLLDCNISSWMRGGGLPRTE